MKEWRFLLQKDGDRSWLPLESSDVILPEGRYRIVGQTGQAHADVSIRICHLATSEEPPKRRIQKRANRTNQNGLIVVVPFTQLQAGIWDFSCFLTDPMSDLLGDTLHHAVRLQIERVAIAAGTEASGALAPEAIQPKGPEAAAHSAELGSVAQSEAQPVVAVVPEPGSGAELAVARQNGRSQDEPSRPATPSLAVGPTADTHESEGAIAPASELPMPQIEIAQSLGVSMDRLVAMTDQLSHQLVAEIFQEFNLVTAEPEAASAADSVGEEALEAPLAEAPAPHWLTVEGADLVLELAQSGWLARRGEQLHIAGQVQVNPAIAAQAEAPVASSQWRVAEDGAEPLVVQLELRNPQTSAVFHRDRLELPAEALPWTFGFDYCLPEELATHLVLGEVTLASAIAQVEAEPLANVLFTVTVNPESLVAEFHKINAVLADSTEVEELPEQVAQFSARLFREKAKPKLDMSFLEITAPAETPGVAVTGSDLATATLPKRAIALPPQILPPKLYEPEPADAGKRTLQLPVFQAKSVSPVVDAGVETPPDPAPVELEHPAQYALANVFGMSEAELETLVVTETAASAEGMGDGAEASGAIAAAVAELKTAVVGAGDDPAQPIGTDLHQPPSERSAAAPLFEELASPIQTAFQSLRLQDRFLERLNSLATDSELSTLLKLMHPEVLVEQAVEQGRAVVTVDGVITSAPDAETMAMDEVVVLEDDPVWQEWVRRAGSKAKRVEPEVRLPIENPLLLPEDQPVPVPALEVLTTEIIAGKTLRVQVKLPYLRPKVYVKLWLNDRQTRTLLDGPRWLVDFFADGFGGMEATTQFTAPLGSLDVRLEAIAVEMQTQRESQKTGLDLTIDPAEIPDDLFEGIDLSF